ncbi:helix-turn-helix domain-containing protein [Streptomyces sp. NPDC058401]|uniref:helix-turn-helix domain-containing protein n=1 Tax=Streptomyces sp. NPDC058401 TaxID=3346480 RepID=UPI003662F7CA
MTQSVTELGLPTPKERRRLREAADLTHEEVAAAVGVTSNTVRSWETGRTHPRGRKLEAYSKLLTRLSADESAASTPSGPTSRTDGSASPDRPGQHGTGPDTDRGRGRGDSPADAPGAPGRAGTGPGTDRDRGDSPGTASGTPDRTGQHGTGPGTDRGREDNAATASGTPRTGSDPAQSRGGSAAAATGSPARANGAAAPQGGAATASGPAGADADADSDTDAASAAGNAPDAGVATGRAPADADAASAAEAAEAAEGAEGAESSDTSEAPEGRFGLRMMRGLTRPVGAQTRPKAAVKRAAKPPVGMPRHEAKSPARAGAAASGNHGGGGGGRSALRPGSPLPPDTGAAKDAAADTGSGTGAQSEPRSGKAAARNTGTGPAHPQPAGADAEAATRTSGTGPGSGPDPASAAGKAAGPDTASDTASGSGADRATGTAPDPAPAGQATAPAGPGADPGTPGSPPAQAGTAPQDAPGPDVGEDAPATTATPSAAFDALYERTAPALARQAYLLTGRRTLSCEAVERAFQQAWERWPEVATDPDPVGWVRSATYEYALSPWHRFRRSHRHPDKPPADPADRVLLDAMLALPPAHRRTVLLYDGVGLDLPDTAAETEASTPTAGSRLVNAHADLADQLPELDGVAPAKQSAVLRERLGALRPAGPLEPRVAAAVRVAGEHRNRLWTRAVVGVTAVIAAATAYTWVTAPTEYEPPRAPGASVSGVPPHSGPQQLTDEGRQLHDKLLSDPSAGPSRIGPSLE